MRERMNQDTQSKNRWFQWLGKRRLTHKAAFEKSPKRSLKRRILVYGTTYIVAGYLFDLANLWLHQNGGLPYLSAPLDSQGILERVIRGYIMGGIICWLLWKEEQPRRSKPLLSPGAWRVVSATFAIIGAFMMGMLGYNGMFKELPVVFFPFLFSYMAFKAASTGKVLGA